MRLRRRPTLAQAFALAMIALGIMLGALFSVVLRSSRETVLMTSEKLRDGAGRQIVGHITDYLGQAVKALDRLEAEIQHQTFDPRNTDALESALFSSVLADPDLTEVSLTYARALPGERTYNTEGEIQLEPRGRGQVSVIRKRDASGGERVVTQLISQNARGEFLASERDRPINGSLHCVPLQSAKKGSQSDEDLADPTQHLTFLTPASRAFAGQPLWSDLHFPDWESPTPVVSIQRAVSDARGQFLGVLRAGLSAEKIDRITEFRVNPSDPADAHRVFLADGDGRLITRLGPGAKFEEDDGDIRASTDGAPKALLSALQMSELEQVGAESPVASGRLVVDGVASLLTFRALEKTQDWIVGIWVPEDAYLGPLVATRNRLIAVSGILIGLILVGGLLLLRSISRAQRQIVDETSKMNRFDFSPTEVFHSPFSDVEAAIESLGKAKTAMRALGKYAPLELIKKLYHDNTEPELGGEQRDITVLFTDIAGFTTISETLSTGLLAEALGDYLKKMVGVIQTEKRGTVDKFIGDAIMAMWNAPGAEAEHPILACAAAVECERLGRELSESSEWKQRGLPPFHTRFGLHRTTAMVGHFGAPDRMSYTAIGDGVNLASRLEGLNKQYGTSIIASEAVAKELGGRFETRKLDRVAVKGKNEGITVYEILGGVDGTDAKRVERARVYEKALELHFDRKFDAAIQLLKPIASQDAPSRVLLERCEEYVATPPPSDWSGVYISHEK